MLIWTTLVLNWRTIRKFADMLLLMLVKTLTPEKVKEWQMRLDGISLSSEGYRRNVLSQSMAAFEKMPSMTYFYFLHLSSLRGQRQPCRQTKCKSSEPGDAIRATLTVINAKFIDRKSTRLNSSHSQISY